MIRQDIDVIKIPENDDHRMCSDICIPTCSTIRPGVAVSARGVWDRLTKYHTELGRRDFSTL